MKVLAVRMSIATSLARIVSNDYQGVRAKGEEEDRSLIDNRMCRWPISHDSDPPPFQSM